MVLFGSSSNFGACWLIVFMDLIIHFFETQNQDVETFVILLLDFNVITFMCVQDNVDTYFV